MKETTATFTYIAQKIQKAVEALTIKLDILEEMDEAIVAHKFKNHAHTMKHTLKELQMLHTTLDLLSHPLDRHPKKLISLDSLIESTLSTLHPFFKEKNISVILKKSTPLKKRLSVSPIITSTALINLFLTLKNYCSTPDELILSCSKKDAHVSIKCKNPNFSKITKTTDLTHVDTLLQSQSGSLTLTPEKSECIITFSLPLPS